MSNSSSGNTSISYGWYWANLCSLFLPVTRVLSLMSWFCCKQERFLYQDDIFLFLSFLFCLQWGFWFWKWSISTKFGTQQGLFNVCFKTKDYRTLVSLIIISQHEYCTTINIGGMLTNHWKLISKSTFLFFIYYENWIALLAWSIIISTWGWTCIWHHAHCNVHPLLLNTNIFISK